MSRPYPPRRHRASLGPRAAGEHMKAVAVDPVLSDRTVRHERRTHLPHLSGTLFTRTGAWR
ncbi:hypothetical protein [Streptomyces sp. NPDC001070]